MRGLLTFILISTIFISSAFAESLTALDLRKHSQAIPRQLLELNVESLGKIKMIDLMEELEGVEWILNPSGTYFSGSGKDRTGAVYLVEKRRVIVNQAIALGPFLPVLALHEGMGALGYIDENGELSLSAATEAIRRKKHGTSSVEIPSLARPFAEPRRVYKNQIYQIAGTGGATSVGGGGEPVAMEAKLLSILAIAETMQVTKDRREFLRLDAILDRLIPSEFENGIGLLETEVKFESRSGKTVILIPYAEWYWILLNPESSIANEKRERMLQKILQHFGVIK